MAGPQNATHDTDAGAQTEPSAVGPDLDAFVVAFLTEYARAVQVACPCQVKEHAFSSRQECMSMQGDPLGHLDCATRVLRPADSPELRAWLRCRIEEFQARTACLEAHSCDRAETNACYELMMSCPDVDAQAFTPLIYSCMGLFGGRM
jgi:hypothetical protein